MPKRTWALRKQIAIEILKNQAMRVPAVQRARIRAAPRTAIVAGDIGRAELDRYVFALLRKTQETAGDLAGKRVAEIGPGDHLATGIAFLAAGASSYVSLDRFCGDYDSPLARAWYRAVRDAWPAVFPNHPWPDWLDPDRFPGAYPDRVSSVREGVEAASGVPVCDVVCSYAVGEHVSDVEAFGRTTREMLTPGGVAMHLVDFNQHFDWVKYGGHYVFLSISERVWRWMGSARGLENRVRYHEFVDAMVRQGLTVETVHKIVVPDVPDVERLAPRFRAMPLESLQTLQATFVCRPTS